MAIVVSDASRRTSNSISYQPSRRALDEDLADRARGQPGGDPRRGLLERRREATAPAAERERRPHDDRRVEHLHEAQPVVDGLDDRRLRHRLADPGHQRSESATVLGGPDGIERRAEHAHLAAVEHARVIERHRQVQPGLAAERRQQGVRPVLLDHPRDPLEGERRQDHGPADVGIGHDRCRVRVHEHGLDTRLTERQAGLHAGVVEFGRLADEDRAGADDEHLARHAHASAASSARSKMRVASIGPGAPSGWNWTDAIRPLACTSPSTVPSFRSRWLTR